MAQSLSKYQSRPGVMGTSGRLAPIEGPTGLRNRQERRIRQSCTVDHVHRNIDCNGVPWPTYASRKADRDAQPAR